MTLDPRTPVLVGSGQISHRAEGIDDALSPIALMAEAVRLAAADAGLRAVPNADSIRVVELLSWRYRDPARFVAAELGMTPNETAMSTGGGNSPQSLVNQTALEIQSGALDLAILTGAEAWRTRGRARKSDLPLPWPTIPEDVTPNRVLGEPLVMNHPGETERGIYLPIQVYPLFESALRASLGTSPEDHLTRIAELWSRFSAVAARNPYAWSRTARTAHDIATVTPTNRMVGLPYTKSMNSNNDVDQGAAVLMCSVEAARSLGISEDRWVFPHSGTDCREHGYVSERWTFADTPAVRRGGEVALELAGVDIDDIAIVDLYSCFPSAVQLGAAALGLSLDRQLTRTGGLNFAGGPWNNYVMHAIATVMHDLRDRPGDLGLVWANGGYATKHSFGIYSTNPPSHPFRHAKPQEAIDALPRRSLASPTEAAGPVVVEAYTVMHDRSSHPEQVIAACLLADGRRAWGLTSDDQEVAEWCHGEWVGRRVTLDADGLVHG